MSLPALNQLSNTQAWVRPSLGGFEFSFIGEPDDEGNCPLIALPRLTLADLYKLHELFAGAIYEAEEKPCGTCHTTGVSGWVNNDPEQETVCKDCGGKGHRR